MKIPVSAFFNKPVSEVWERILRFHAPPPAKILDPTCGDKLLWKGLDVEDYDITYSDIKLGQDLFDISDGSYDLIIYDPPYFFGTKGSKISREKEYGGYSQSYESLQTYMEGVLSLAQALVDGGKLVLKCADQYHVPSKTFHIHHLDWLLHMEEQLQIIDFFIYKHAHSSPTAWLVKNRQSSVIVHTYFIVGVKPWV